MSKKAENEIQKVVQEHKKIKPLYKFRNKFQCISLSFLWLLWLQLPAIANDDLVEDLTTQWKYYEAALQDYMPFYPNQNHQITEIHLLIPRQKFPNVNILLQLEGFGEGSIFFDNKLVKKFNDEQVTISLDFHNEGQLLLLTLHLKIPPVALPVAEVCLNNQGMATEPIYQGSIYPENKIRSLEGPSEFMVYAVLMLIVYAFLSYFSPRIWSISELSQTFTESGGKRARSSRSIGFDLIIFLLYYSVSGAFLLSVLYAYQPDYPSYSFQYFSSDTEPSFVFIYFFLLVLGLSLIKFAVVFFVGSIHNIRELSVVHFQEMIQIGQIFATITLLLGVFMLLVPAEYSIPAIMTGVAALFVLKTLLISYRINRQVALKNIFIISYFCGTEIIPALFTIEFFAG